MLKFVLNGTKYTVVNKAKQDLQHELKLILGVAPNIGGLILETEEVGEAYFVINATSQITIYEEA